MTTRKAPARPRRASDTNRTALRGLQKALAVATCIRIAAHYAEEDEFDVADALAGLLIVMEGTAALLDQPEVSP